MNKKLKTALFIAIPVAVIAIIAGVIAFKSANTSGDNGEAQRKAIKKTFSQNVTMFDSVFDSLKKESRIGQEYCVIINNGDADVKVEYENVTVKENEELENLIEDFVNATGCNVIYSDGQTMYIKREFNTDETHRYEANFARRYNGEALDKEGCEKLNDDWYYFETEIE